MKASELVERLQQLIEEHGDQKVYMYTEIFEDGDTVCEAEYTDAIERAYYYKADPPGEGPGICVKG